MNHSTRILCLQSMLLAATLGAVAPGVFAQASLTVDVDNPGHSISPSLWGIFFEDINLSADGGIYPELVRNRSFEDSDKPDFWTLPDSNGGKSTIAIESTHPLNPFNRHNLHVTLDGSVALENEGYWGMNMVKGDMYAFKIAVRAADGFAGPLTVRVLGASGDELAKGEVSDLSRAWHYHTLHLTAAASDPKARLEISATGQG